MLAALRDNQHNFLAHGTNVLGETTATETNQVNQRIVFVFKYARGQTDIDSSMAGQTDRQACKTCIKLALFPRSDGNHVYF